MSIYNRATDFTYSVALETLQLLLGEKLGGGAYRDVFAMTLNPDLVLKVEPENNSRFSNIQEWTVWNEVQDDPELARWFAPCHHISSCGTILIQSRTKPLKKLPAEVPNVMTDVKLANMGLYKGRPVFHDYGNHKLYLRGMRRWKLVPGECL